MKAIVQKVTKASVTGDEKLYGVEKYFLPEFSGFVTTVLFSLSKFYFSVGERCTGSIGQGMCVLLGISTKDTDQEIEWM